MITYESEPISLGRGRQRMRIVFPVPISYLFTLNTHLFSASCSFSFPVLHFCYLSFLYYSSFCPSITPFLTISPDPLLILILLPHGSITHFRHFCIYTKERGAPLFFLKPPKLSPPIPPNIDPKTSASHTNSYYCIISFSIKCECF